MKGRMSLLTLPVTARSAVADVVSGFLSEEKPHLEVLGGLFFLSKMSSLYSYENYFDIGHGTVAAGFG